jgi:hypothetical protein
VTDSARREPNPADDKGEVWGIPALDLISMRSGYIGSLGIPMIFDLVVFHVLVHYFQLWYPISFAISCMIGAAVDHYDRPLKPI